MTWQLHDTHSRRQKDKEDWLADPGGGSRPPIRSDACLKLKLLHWQDHISLSNWLIFLMKRRLHFPTKLNPRAIQKCNYFWVSSWSVCLCSQSSISCTNRESCSQIEKHVVVSAFSAGQKRFNSHSEPTFGPPQPKVPGSAPVNPYYISEVYTL